MEKDKPILILVDYFDFVYSSFYNSSKDCKIRPWMHCVRALESLKKCVSDCRRLNTKSPIEFIFCGDGGRTHLHWVREETTPSKAKNAYVIYRQLVSFKILLQSVITFMGIGIAYRTDTKGEDLLASVVAKYCTKCDCATPCKVCKCAAGRNTKNIIIFTSNKEMYQLLNFNNVRIYKPSGGFYTKENYINEYKTKPIFIKGNPYKIYSDVNPDAYPVHVYPIEGIKRVIARLYNDKALDDILFAARHLEQAAKPW